MSVAKRLLTGLLLVCLLAALTGCGQGSGGRGSEEPADAEKPYVSIQVDGREVRRVPLSRPQTVTVDQGDGVVNVIEVNGRGAVMKSSTCDNQICVHMGEVNVDNWEYRVNGAFIICLPNRVTVELVVQE